MQTEKDYVIEEALKAAMEHYRSSNVKILDACYDNNLEEWDLLIRINESFNTIWAVKIYGDSEIRVSFRSITTAKRL